MRTFMRCALAILASALLPLPCLADTYTYTYTGNDFTTVYGGYTTNDSVTGEFTLSTPLAANLGFALVTPISYSFSDGLQTISNLDTGSYSGFYVWTDATGALSEWEISLAAVGNSSGMYILNVPGDVEDYGYYGGVYQADNQNSSGTWTVTSDIAAVPEPSSLLLLSTGSVGMLSLLRRVRDKKLFC